MAAGTRLLFNRPTWPSLAARFVVFGPATFVLIRRLHDAVVDMAALPGRDVLHEIHIDGIQLLAWGVAFYLLGRPSPAREPNSFDIIGAIIVCVIAILDSAVSLAALAFFLVVTGAGDGQRRAAATVFAALFVHQAILPIVYPLLLPTLTQLDAMLVGAAVKLTIAGATSQNNIIALPSGHAIEILGECCSFHNVSLATLSWVALTKLERLEWQRLDAAVLVAAAGCQVLLNAVRLYLMAQSPEMYLYWHNGGGPRIFSVCASVAAVLISAFGAHLVSLGATHRPLVASPLRTQ